LATRRVTVRESGYGGGQSVHRNGPFRIAGKTSPFRGGPSPEVDLPPVQPDSLTV
jgi:hypothetical protein